jgi:hypothetical protein
MALRKLSLLEGIRQLDRGVNDFYLEVELLDVEERLVTSKGNIFVRVLIKDEETIATLVVWGSANNTENIEVIERHPKKIRIIRPVKPSDWAKRDYNVDLWAHERVTKIEEILPNKNS